MSKGILHRYDAILLAGLTTAMLVIFAHPLRVALDAAREFEGSHGLSLVPALVVLAVVFGFQQQAKRHDAAAHAASAAAEAMLNQARANDLEELVHFGRTLAEALDMDAVREAMWRHLPSLVQSRRTWLLVREESRWKAVAGVRQLPGQRSVNEELEAVATWIASRESIEGRLRGLDVADHVGFPLVFGDSVVGVLGVAQDQQSLAEAQRRILAAAAPLLAIAIKNAQLFAGLRDATVHDSLTGCFTRMRAIELLDTELRRADRSGLPLSVIMIDLDHFKQINDRHGHQAGDAVLSMVGRHLRDVLRASDIQCRYGGEEFLLVLPDTSATGARRVAESLRQAFQELVVRWEHTDIPVTASFGIATSRAGDRSVPSLVARADGALYQAKQAGRNCVREHQDTSPARSEAPPSHSLRMVVPAQILPS